MAAGFRRDMVVVGGVCVWVCVCVGGGGGGGGGAHPDAQLVVVADELDAPIPRQLRLQLPCRLHVGDGQ